VHVKGERCSLEYRSKTRITNHQALNVELRKPDNKEPPVSEESFEHPIARFFSGIDNSAI
jgi:hypothetical protein